MKNIILRTVDWNLKAANICDGMLTLKTGVCSLEVVNCGCGTGLISFIMPVRNSRAPGALSEKQVVGGIMAPCKNYLQVKTKVAVTVELKNKTRELASEHIASRAEMGTNLFLYF